MLTKQFKVRGRVHCQKCGDEMTLAAITSHPINTEMERQTFLCTKCNQTKTYVVPIKQAHHQQAVANIDQTA